MKQFRFGVVAAQAPTAADWLARAQRIEALGFDTLLVPDGIRYTLSPFVALAAAAAATSTLRFGTYVLANDFRHPTLVAKEAASLDFLSGGRFELGLGAGRPAASADNGALGLDFDSGSVRVARLAESIGLVKRLLAGETLSASGAYYQMHEAQVGPRPAGRLPLLVAGAGPRMLELAAREADIVALGAGPEESETAAADMLAHLRRSAGERFDQLEVNVNLMGVGDRVPRHLSARLGLDAAALERAKSVAAVAGSVEDMCAQLRDRRARLGISYICVADELMDAFAPVAERLHGS
jgi:probable F420-dependent oxidoreductase